MMMGAAAHWHRHQETTRGADRHDARKQEHHAQTTKHMILLSRSSWFISRCGRYPAAGGGGGGEPTGAMSGAAGTAGGGGAAMYA